MNHQTRAGDYPELRFMQLVLFRSNVKMLFLYYLLQLKNANTSLLSYTSDFLYSTTSIAQLMDASHKLLLCRRVLLRAKKLLFQFSLAGTGVLNNFNIFIRRSILKTNYSHPQNVVWKQITFTQKQ